MPLKTTSFKSALAFQNRTMVLFYSRIEQQTRVLQLIQSVLPDELKCHARYCVINNKLLIYTDSASWASQLRFYNNVILAAIAPITKETIRIMQIKLLATQSADGLKTKRKTLVPTLEKISLIRNQGLTITDEQLKQALLKLSATLERQAG